MLSRYYLLLTSLAIVGPVVPGSLEAPEPLAVGTIAPPSTETGQPSCMDDTDFDAGWCWARLNWITDPNDCLDDAPSDEFVEGCLSFTGVEGLEYE